MDELELHILEGLFSKSVDQKTVRNLRKEIEKLPTESQAQLSSEVVQRLKQLLQDDPILGLSSVSLFSDSCLVLQQCLNECMSEVLSSCITGLQKITPKFHFASKAVYGALQSMSTQNIMYEENPAIVSQLKQIFASLVSAVLDVNLPSDCALITATSLCIIFTYLMKGNMTLKFYKLLKFIEIREKSCNERVTETHIELFESDCKRELLFEDKEATFFNYEDIEISYPVALIIHGLLNSGMSWIYSVGADDAELSIENVKPKRSSMRMDSLGFNHRLTEEEEESQNEINTDAASQVSSSSDSTARSSKEALESFHEKEIREGRNIFLYSLYPLIQKLCRSSSSYAFQAFQVLHSWLLNVRKRNLQYSNSSSGHTYLRSYPSKIAEFAIDSEYNNTVFHLLNSNWENPTKGVSDVVYSCMMELLRLHEDEIPGRAKAIAMRMMSALVTANAWNLKSTYPPLALAISYTGAEMALQEYPSIPNGLLESLRVNYLAPPGTSVYKIILNHLSSEVWSEYFLSPVLKALHSHDRMSRQNVLMFWLPITVRQYPDIYVKLLSNCQSSSEGWIARMAILKVARTCGTVNINENIELNFSVKTKDYTTITEDIESSENEKLGERNKGNSLSVLAILQYAINHIDEMVRSEALAFLCITKKASQSVTLEEATLMKDFFTMNMNIDSAPFRQTIIKCFKALVLRLRDACGVALKSSPCKPVFTKEGIPEWDFKDLETNSSVLFVNGSLLVWFLKRFHFNLKPGSNYQRRILSLQLYKEMLLAFFEINKNSEYIANKRFLAVCSYISYVTKNLPTCDDTDIISQPVVDVTLPWTSEMLLCCCLDEMNDIREGAENILEILELSRVKPGRNEIEKWLHRGLVLCNSPKASDVESGASIVKVITSVSYSADVDIATLLQENDMPKGSKGFLHFLLNRVEGQFRAAHNNLLVAATNAPIHGSLLALGRCLCENRYKTSACPEDVKEILRSLLELLEEIVEFVLKMLALSSQKGSAVAPSFAEMGESIEMIIEKSFNEKTEIDSCKILQCDTYELPDNGADENNDEETAISGNHALVLACCWQSLKACCLVSSMCVSQFISTLSENQVECVLRAVIIRVLTGTRHKGAMEAARMCYSHLSTLLLSTNSSFGHLVRRQVDDVLNQLKSGAETSITRRAAGMAMMVQVACGAVPRTNKVLIDTTVTRLISIAQMEYEEQNTMDSPPVLALHILHSLVIHASLAHHIAQHMPAITVVCLKAFTSNSWALRNAALQLYGSVVSRMVGQKKVRDDSSTLNSLTACEFMSRNPELAEHLLGLLQKAINDEVEGTDADINNPRLTSNKPQSLSIKTSSHLVPVMSLLARLSPGTGLQQSQEISDRLSKYCSVTTQLLGSPIHTVRRLASLSVVALTSSEQAHKVISNLIESLGSKTLNTNKLHGHLLTIKNFLKTYSEFLSDKALKGLLLCVLNPIMESSNKCFINATLALKILDLYQVKDINLEISSIDVCQPGAPQFIQTYTKLRIRDFSNDEMERFVIYNIFSHQHIEDYFLNYVEEQLNSCVNNKWMEEVEKIIWQKCENIEYLRPSLIRILCIILNKNSSIKITHSEKSMKNLLLLLKGYHGAKTASKTLIVISYIIKNMHKKQSEGSNKTEIISAFTSVISEYSNPTSTEDYRLAASDALVISARALLSSPVDINAVCKERVIVACINLLQDEDSYIRESACRIVFTLQKNPLPNLVSLKEESETLKRQTAEVVHPNLALSYFVEIIVKSTFCEKDWKTLRLLWRLCYVDETFDIEKNTKLYLFQSHAINLYKEPKHFSLCIAETFKKVMKEDAAERRISIVGGGCTAEQKIIEWFQHECEALNKQGMSLKALLNQHQHLLTERKLLTVVSMYIIAHKTLISLSNILGIHSDLSYPMSWEEGKFCEIKVS